MDNESCVILAAWARKTDLAASVHPKVSGRVSMAEIFAGLPQTVLLLANVATIRSLYRVSYGVMSPINFHPRAV